MRNELGITHGCFCGRAIAAGNIRDQGLNRVRIFPASFRNSYSDDETGRQQYENDDQRDNERDEGPVASSHWLSPGAFERAM